MDSGNCNPEFTRLFSEHLPPPEQIVCKDSRCDRSQRHSRRYSSQTHQSLELDLTCTNLVHAAPNHTQRPWCRELNNYHKQGFDVSGTFFAISGDDWHNSNLLQNTVLWRKV